MASMLIMLQIVSFLDLLSIGLIVPQLTNHARQLGLNFFHIGMIGALYSACQTISAPIIGSLSDIRGTKPIFLLCLGICSFSYVWLGITSSIIIFMMLRGILGIFKQIQLLVKAVIAENCNDTNEQGVLYGKLIAIAGLGMSVGPVVSGHVIEAYPTNGFTILSCVVGAVFAVNIGFIYSIPFKCKDKKEIPNGEAVTHTLLQSMGNTLKESVNEFYKVDWPIFWDVFVYKMLMALTMGLYFSNFALFLKTEHDVSPKSIGYMVAFQGVIGASSNLLIRHINKLYKVDTDYSKRIFHIFLIITLSLVGLASVPEAYMYIVFIVPKSVCLSIARVVLLEMTTSRGNPDQKGAIMGVSNSVKSLTGVITPIISGVVTQYLGIRYAFYVAACFNGIGTVLSYCNLKKPKTKKEKIK
ncbi:unnamed protein product [Arctia plantaginis]|uniref:Major facilitator superfamily (MFS) profile domain-containing protein n=1 Tax=Arctia plantaginis TaxID=874455 RepID=A0A8S0ZWC2_ARCPL|nr:unnamed protein product [Arctia plantaginis]